MYGIYCAKDKNHSLISSSILCSAGFLVQFKYAKFTIYFKNKLCDRVRKMLIRTYGWSQQQQKNTEKAKLPTFEVKLYSISREISAS